MIGQREVQRFAYEQRVAEQTVERDYILTWAMIGITQEASLSTLVAKGGTSLKKLYFSDWRYSEDLDYTSERQVEPDTLRQSFERVCTILHKDVGIECAVTSIEPRYNDEQLRNVTLYLDYVGPLQRTRRPRQIKLDVTFDEHIINVPISRMLLRQFSDEPSISTSLQVYSLEEITAEKLRSLIQRTEPRDLYDVWRLLEEHRHELDFQKLHATFIAKCSSRGIAVKDGADLLSAERLRGYEAAWQRRLGEQVIDLPTLNQIVRETRQQLRELFG